MLRRKHLRNVAKLATKVSPIPIPDIVKDQISGATDKIEELSKKIANPGLRSKTIIALKNELTGISQKGYEI